MNDKNSACFSIAAVMHADTHVDARGPLAAHNHRTVRPSSSGWRSAASRSIRRWSWASSSCSATSQLQHLEAWPCSSGQTAKERRLVTVSTGGARWVTLTPGTDSVMIAFMMWLRQRLTLEQMPARSWWSIRRHPIPRSCQSSRCKPSAAGCSRSRPATGCITGPWIGSACAITALRPPP